MAYGDQENKNQEKKEEPHQDLDKNIEYFNRIIEATYWVPDYVYEIQAPDYKRFINYKISDTRSKNIYNPTTARWEALPDEITKYKNVTFIWGERRMSKDFCTISFHQDHKKIARDPGFCNELAALMNKLGQKGYIKHRFKNEDRSTRPFSLPLRYKFDITADAKKGELEVIHPTWGICPLTKWQDRADPSNNSKPLKDDWIDLFGNR